MINFKICKTIGIFFLRKKINKLGKTYFASVSTDAEKTGITRIAYCLPKNGMIGNGTKGEVTLLSGIDYVISSDFPDKQIVLRNTTVDIDEIVKKYIIAMGENPEILISDNTLENC